MSGTTRRAPSTSDGADRYPIVLTRGQGILSLVHAPLVVTSPANPRLKSLLALRRRRHREEAGETPVEGYEELALALDAGVRPIALYFCPELHAAGQEDLADRAAATGAELVQLSRSAFEK